MSDNDVPPQKPPNTWTLLEIGAAVKYWQRILNLNHWRISWQWCDPTRTANRGALMEIRPIRVRQTATIYITRGLLEKVDCVEFQKLLVHELVHLIVDPIAEEHDLQTKFDVITEKSLENKERFVRQLERAVEHTARMLCSVLPLKAEWGDQHPLLDAEINEDW